MIVAPPQTDLEMHQVLFEISVLMQPYSASHWSNRSNYKQYINRHSVSLVSRLKPTPIERPMDKIASQRMSNNSCCCCKLSSPFDFRQVPINEATHVCPLWISAIDSVQNVFAYRQQMPFFAVAVVYEVVAPDEIVLPHDKTRTKSRWRIWHRVSATDSWR